MTPTPATVWPEEIRLSKAKDSLFVKKSVDRNKYYLAQTPQIAMSQSLETAIELSLKENFVPGDAVTATSAYKWFDLRQCNFVSPDF